MVNSVKCAVKGFSQQSTLAVLGDKERIGLFFLGPPWGSICPPAIRTAPDRGQLLGWTVIVLVIKSFLGMEY